MINIYYERTELSIINKQLRILVLVLLGWSGVVILDNQTIPTAEYILVDTDANSIIFVKTDTDVLLADASFHNIPQSLDSEIVSITINPASVVTYYVDGEIIDKFEYIPADADYRIISNESVGEAQLNLTAASYVVINGADDLVASLLHSQPDAIRGLINEQLTMTIPLARPVLIISKPSHKYP